MADFDAPSFSLGLDCDLFDSEPQITPVTRDRDPTSSNEFPVAFATFADEDEEFETLVVDDSEPEYPDSHPKLNRPISNPSCTDQHLQPVKRKQHLSNDREPDSTSCNNIFPKLISSTLRGFQLTDSDDPFVSSKCNGSDSNSNFEKYDDDLPQHVNRKQNVSNASEDFPKAYHYFFHDDQRIQELVRSRLPNFSPLGNMLNIDLEQPSTSKIDYMGQFSFDECSKQAARTIKNKKISRKLETEEMAQGWVNPKLGVGKVTTKRKRKVCAARQTAGHWLTGSDGKKVYVGKSGQELTGRVAYMQYKKESGSGFKKVKRKSVTKKKKK